jgi:serine protease AprX
MMKKLLLVALCPALLGAGLALRTPNAADVLDAKLDRALQGAVRGSSDAELRVLLQIAPETRKDMAGRIASAGGSSSALSPGLLSARMSVRAFKRLAADAGVLRASIDAPVRAAATSLLSKDVLLDTEGLLTTSGGTTSRKYPYTGRNVGIAVIDSGIRPNANLNLIATYDFLTSNGKKVSANDPFGHGTHVAGIATGNGTTSTDQYEGIAPAARLYAFRALAANGTGYTSNVINAVTFATANRKTLGIDIINLSLGHPIYEPAASDPLVQAVENAVAAGIVVVVSAGNFGGDLATHAPAYAGITSPGNAPDAITVGALETYQTVTRGDDAITWFSSRGPTWYDAFQKPDLVAPGSHIVSDVPTSSTLASQYPGGLMKTTGTTNLMKLSGTSMAAGVVSGVVAMMLDANRTLHPGAALTPNAIKAILQYTAFEMPAYDVLTEGAGSLNAAGAIALAAAIDPNVPAGSWWLTVGVNAWNTIGGQDLAWGQRIVWGDRIIWGNQVYSNDPAWALRIVWGDRIIWGNRIIWGSSTVWDPASQTVWGTRIIWGSSLLGMTDGTRIIWGSSVPWGSVSPASTVWGNLKTLNIAPANVSWGNVERANMDLK